MHNTREKLIELIKKAPFEGKVLDEWWWEDKIARIADYLIANGVILPPCKIGQEIWLVYSPKHPANPKDKGRWFMLQDGVQRIIYGAKGLSVETWNMGTIPAKEIGKKLFLTKEEAEAALPEPPKGE